MFKSSFSVFRFSFSVFRFLISHVEKREYLLTAASRLRVLSRTILKSCQNRSFRLR